MFVYLFMFTNVDEINKILFILNLFSIKLRNVDQSYMITLFHANRSPTIRYLYKKLIELKRFYGRIYFEFDSS